MDLLVITRPPVDQWKGIGMAGGEPTRSECMAPRLVGPKRTARVTWRRRAPFTRTQRHVSALRFDVPHFRPRADRAGSLSLHLRKSPALFLQSAGINRFGGPYIDVGAAPLAGSSVRSPIGRAARTLAGEGRRPARRRCPAERPGSPGAGVCGGLDLAAGAT